MNILLGCNHLHELGGSEQHLYTLAKEFKAIEHNVFVLLGNFTLKGSMSDLLEKDLSIKVDEIPENLHFDAVFLSHQSTVNRFVEEVYCREDLSFNDSNLFQICHGIFSNLERPSSWHKLNFIGISDEVTESIIELTKGKKEVYEILNPIDTDKFHPTKSNLKIKNVYSLSQNDEFNRVIQEICTEKGYGFKKNNKHTNPNPDIRKNIQEADVVFSLGRGCYEAMSMCKNVIVADSRGYMDDSLMDGLVNADNFKFYVKNNCSGRFWQNKASKENILEELDNYSVSNCDSNRETILKFCDSKKIAKDYLSLIK